MTTQELNRDIARLAKQNGQNESGYIREEYATEYKRLYYADAEFKYMSRASIIRMLAMNRRYEIIKFWLFGAAIDHTANGIFEK